MTWTDHYNEQADAHLAEAHAWITYGKETRAKFHLDCAEVYDQLAKEAEEREQIRPESR